MASSPDLTSMALFCDFENVALGVRETHHEKFDIKLVLERLLLKGSIVVKKAYCDWERYRGFKATMHEANFELIEIPHVRQSGKNSADIRLVVDALDLCYTKAHVNTFVIISGDSDFSPLVSKLRENNKQVIGVGVKQSTSDLLMANCDEFIFYDDLVREVQRSSTRRAPPPPAPARRSGSAGLSPEEERRREELENRRAKGVELAVQTFEALASERADGSKIWASVLKEAIKRRRPDFNESYFGFRSFGGLLEEAQAHGLLEIGRDEKSNAYVTRSSAAPQAAAAAVAETPAASAEPEVLPITHRVGEAEPRTRGRGRSRGGRREAAAERHDFEPVIAVEAAPRAFAMEERPQADDRHRPFPEGIESPGKAVSTRERPQPNGKRRPSPEGIESPRRAGSTQEDDDFAERFADVAREEQAALDTVVVEPVLPAEPVDTTDTPDVADDATETARRDATGRRSNRGGRGRNAAAKKTTAETMPPRRESAPAPAPTPVPAPEAPTPAADPQAPAPKSAGTRARKTAPAKSATGKAAARPRAPRKTAKPTE